MASNYPGALDTFTTKQNKQDDYDASHMNDVQNAIVAAQTELGADVAGDQTNLVTRLAFALSDDGSLNKGTSFPGSPRDGDVFYRTDQDTLYVYNGSSWDSQGQSLSNVLFTWATAEGYGANTHGHLRYTTLTPEVNNDQGTPLYELFGVYGTTYRTFLHFRFKKITGISTVTIHGRLWSNNAAADREAYLKVFVDSLNGEVSSTTTTTPAWATSADIDVSSLSDGTVYSGYCQLKNEYASNNAYCSAVTLIGS